MCRSCGSQFFEWNPAVSEDYVTNFWLEYAYCVGVDESWSSSSSTATLTGTSSVSSTGTSSLSTTETGTETNTETSATGIPTTTSQNTPYSIREPISTWNITTPTIDRNWPPTQTQTSQPSYCNRWHLVGSKDDCESVVNRYGSFLTLEELLEWNPALDDDCSGMYVDYWICVGIRSQITVSLEWSTSVSDFTTPPEASTHTSTVLTVVNSTFTAEPSHGPMPAGCQVYHQVEEGQTCTEILEIYVYITEEEFFTCNPILDDNCSGLWADTWYCVAYYPENDLPMPAHVTTIPTPLIEWNPSVYGDCSGIEQDTWYCVGKSDTLTTRTDSVLTTTTAEDMPTQTGISEDCTDYWLVSDTDTCKSIAKANGVTVANLIAWNSDFGTDCGGLEPEYYICVAVDADATSQATTASTTSTISSASETSTEGPVSTPTPVREGMTTECRKFYLQQSGDLCYSMAQDVGITLEEFYEWNPAVGSDCSNLWPDYYYCIGITGAATTIAA
ncbi:carbohydrate-binding module family 50 protein [Dactylonectria macrodidyma]|uniref:Carbohydrate-binding module family 50 protein n=1 Tax=Dactylonectria macrodidyma TaxID=307937 RepID=A0A9P9EMP9_9HYPO|nr:carbohydrate-binding module family 50 protein [Dactylonectria macrodidyma]